MNIDLVGIGTLVGVAFTALGVIVGVRTYFRQMSAQLFLVYTQRYEEIMQAFPSDARHSRLDMSGAPPEESEAVTTAVLRYLNLCSEEFYLRDKKFLSKDIWAIWENEIKRTLRSPLFRREWQKLSREFDAYGAFAAYVEQAQKG